ncbi:response regulator [Planctomicrobium piriforme]|uniref:DNA-binding response regulator, NarL/FixJ family, contains REC and HTH domains n=1 Tax=Planctomicrobium piriforme TaxID=1576369 RepID=A0A1I3GLV1_9PLAN|nr:response regulator transcription factor [Planctomicrobium piriforme]SFI24232.1 DNA-binding response regulator, NarL/FixJ family, contains REC and HTH domains [Planctomicrobium piriforme]
MSDSLGDQSRTDRVPPGAAGIRVVIVDDHRLVAESLARMLGIADDLHVVGIANNGTEAVEMARSAVPDLILMDIQLPDRSGFDIAADITRRMKFVKVLFLTGSVAELHIEMTLKSKASGLLRKNVSTAFLIEAIRRVMTGEQVFDFDTAQIVKRNADGETATRLGALSLRRLEVARRLALGQSIKDIAEQLHLSEKAVDSHKYRIMKQLDVHDRVELALLAVREGLVQP